jgi:Tfp pilus assembly major pilin PilA
LVVVAVLEVNIPLVRKVVVAAAVELEASV